MKRREFLALTGWNETTYQMLKRKNLLFIASERDDGKWLDLSPTAVFKLCIQKDLGQHVEMMEAKARLLDFDPAFAPDDFARLVVDGAKGRMPAMWALSGVVDGVPVWAVHALSHIAEARVTHRSLPSGWQAGQVRDIENKMSSAVLLNLSEIWAAMDARATAAGIADEHVWGRNL